MTKFTKSIKTLLLKTCIILGLFGFSINVKAQWTLTPLIGYDILSFATSGSNLYAGTNGGGVYLSTNAGTSWNAINTGFPTSSTPFITALAASGSNAFAGTQGLGVYFSSNNGTSWTAVNNSGITVYANVNALAITGTEVFAATDDGLYLSSNNGTTWTLVNSNTNISALAISGSNIYAGIGEGSVILSTNNGTTWTAINSGLPGNTIDPIALAASGSNVFMATGSNNNGVYFSSNNGTTWKAADNNRLTGNQAYSVLINGSQVIAGGYGEVYVSANNGTNWTTIDSTGGLPANGSVYAVAISGGNLFAGVGGPFEPGPWDYPMSKVIGINEITEKNGMSIYPNPVEEMLNIKFAQPIEGIAILKVMDMTGKEISNQTVNSMQSSLSVNVEFLPVGLYFISIQSSDGSMLMEKFSK